MSGQRLCKSPLGSEECPSGLTSVSGGFWSLTAGAVVLILQPELCFFLLSVLSDFTASPQSSDGGVRKLNKVLAF